MGTHGSFFKRLLEELAGLLLTDWLEGSVFPPGYNERGELGSNQEE